MNMLKHYFSNAERSHNLHKHVNIQITFIVNYLNTIHLFITNLIWHSVNRQLSEVGFVWF